MRLSELFLIILDRPVNITNGAMGIPSVTPPRLFGIDFLYPSQFYFIVLVILFFTIFTVRRFEHSKIGRSWKAVRENEIAAQAMGVPLVRTKLMAFAIGASFSGMMGVVFAAKQAFVDPTSFTLLESITILVMVVLGGMGSVPGVILGAARHDDPESSSIDRNDKLVESTKFVGSHFHSVCIISC